MVIPRGKWSFLLPESARLIRELTADLTWIRAQEPLSRVNARAHQVASSPGWTARKIVCVPLLCCHRLYRWGLKRRRKRRKGRGGFGCFRTAESRCDAWRLLGNAPRVSGAHEAVPAERRSAAASWASCGSTAALPGCHAVGSVTGGARLGSEATERSYFRRERRNQGA